MDARDGSARELDEPLAHVYVYIYMCARACVCTCTCVRARARATFRIAEEPSAGDAGTNAIDSYGQRFHRRRLIPVSTLSISIRVKYTIRETYREDRKRR